jgi:hypothetical protein
MNPFEISSCDEILPALCRSVCLVCSEDEGRAPENLKKLI